MRRALFVLLLLCEESWPVLAALVVAVLLVWLLPLWVQLSLLGSSAAVLVFGYLLRRHRDGWQDE